MKPRSPGPRPAVIGACVLSNRDVPRERLLGNGLMALDRIARDAASRGWGLDLAVLPENFAHPPGSDPFDTAEDLDGPILSAMGAKARELRANLAVPVRLRDGARVFNSVAMLDRQGRLLGTYRKVFPVVLPDGSVEGGMTPGRDFPAFDLDIGRVGVQVCFDACFEDGWARLGEQGAELVLYPSAAPSVSALVSYAWRHAYYTVGSTWRAPALVVNPLGRELARATKEQDTAVVRVDLDYRILPSRFTWTRGPEIKKKYGERIDFGWHDAECACLLTSRDPALPIGRLVEDEGLETMSAFLARNLQAQAEARAADAGRAVAAAAGRG
ncbi:MAG: carbon-nitrogen hydrolase family protein [Planctomycetota bacterium]|nr:carbon-nitrogen hydrolase family protein [Planctomycetota bacterium]